MPEQTSIPAATNADDATTIIPIRRGSALGFTPPSAKGYCFLRSDGSGNATGGTAYGNVAWTTTTPMHLGFVGEAITHVAALRLVQDGVISLDDNVMTLLGKTGVNFANIKVKHLLRHTSGLAGATNVIDHGLGPGTLGSVDGYVSAYLAATNSPLPTPVGTFQRNPIDTTMLQDIIHLKAPGGYVQYVKDTILTPLGITDAQLRNGSINPAGTRTLAYSGSADAGNGFDWEAHTFFPWYAWVGTPTGLLAFITGMRTNGTILNTASLATLLDGSTAWRRGEYGTVTYVGSNATWAYDSSVPTPYPGLAVAAVSYTPAGGPNVDAVLFANSPVSTVVDLVVDGARSSSG